MRYLLLTLAIVSGVTSVAFGDKVTMKDGTVRNGTIIDQQPDTIRMRINSDGMTATVVLPMDDISKIEKGVVTTKPATSQKSPSITTAPAAQATSPAPTATAAATPKAGGLIKVQQSRGFVMDLVMSAAGWGPGSIQSLPPQLQKLWGTAVQADAANKKVETLEAQRALVDAFSQSDGGLDWLDGLSKRERQETFGTWMARTHWAVAQSTYRNGNLDLKDVTDIERPALVGILKEQSTAALEPIKSYFPPVDEKTGKAQPFRPQQLSGISIDNAIDVKDKSFLARALLLAQVKIEPKMAAPDKALIFGQLNNVNHIAARANELEPAAKAAAAKRKG